MFRKKTNDNVVHSAYIGEGVECVGFLQFEGTVFVDGIFRGDVVSDGTLILGKTGQVEGSIKVGDLYSDGSVRGDVEVQNKTVLRPRSNLIGDLKTVVLVVEEGAVVDGNIETEQPQAELCNKVVELKAPAVESA